MSWKRHFDDPIVLPDGRRLVTLLDAATYATKLPKNEAGTAEWQCATPATTLATSSWAPLLGTPSQRGARENAPLPFADITLGGFDHAEAEGRETRLTVACHIASPAMSPVATAAQILNGSSRMTFRAQWPADSAMQRTKSGDSQQ